MAWYVESLILDSSRIQARVVNEAALIVPHSSSDDNDDADRFIATTYMGSSFDNPLYDDLLMVEKTISILYAKGTINNLDIDVLDVLSSGGSLVSMAEREGIDLNMLIKYFFTACNKISYELQGHFTDAGYIKYMCDKHGLDKQQIKKMVRYMQKSRRTRIRRLINDKATY